MSNTYVWVYVIVSGTQLKKTQHIAYEIIHKCPRNYGTYSSVFLTRAFNFVFQLYYIILPCGLIGKTIECQSSRRYPVLYQMKTICQVSNDVKREGR